MAITDEQYVNLVTFTSDGRAKPTPVWIVDVGVDDDGARLAGFTTWGESWKARRIRATPAVTLQPCDMRGNVEEGSDVVHGTATVVANGPEVDKVKALVRQKYGVWVSVIRTMNSIRSALGKGGQSDSAVIITLS